ncbi:MAG: TldD/PmbA family protein, partial [Candidatus Marinimicrobia bacterium]|nr:TldD/PmbA family protein [Candidatus Neomarinimicrobiota bacterium]
MDLKKLLSQINISADWIGLREVREKGTYRVIRDGNPQANGAGTSHGIMVEVLANGQFGYYATNDMSISGIQNAAAKAKAQAIHASEYSLYSFSEDARPKATGEYESSFSKAAGSVSAGEINEILLAGCDALKVSDKIVSASAYGLITETEFNFVSTNGSDINQKFLMVTSDFSATAQDGNIFQRRTGGRSGHQIGLEVFDKSNITNLCAGIGQQAVELLFAEECPTGTMDMVLAPDQMMLQIHESIGHALEIDRILGDERNYAGWSFIRLEDFGTLQYGSNLMNVTFDPTVEHELASYAFDDGGLEAQREYIIKDGLLVRGLGGKESQIRSNTPGVANFRASSWNRAPIDRMANLNLEAGESSFDDIISNIEYGVYMET